MSSEARRQPLSRRQRPDRFRPELNPVKVLEDVLGNGFEETWRRQGEPAGRKGLLRSESAAASFSRARRSSFIPVVLPGGWQYSEIP